MWVFTVSQVKQPILGADFFSARDLVVDMNKKKLVDKDTRLQVNGTITTNCEIQVVRIIKPTNKVFIDVLSKYECITRVDYQNERSLHYVQHHITTSAPPICARSRRLPAHKLKREVEHMMQLGIIRQSSGPWASVLHMVPKKVQNPRQIPNSSSARLFPGSTWKTHFPEIWPCESISSNSYSTRRYRKNSHNRTFWFVWILTNAIQALKNSAQTFKRFMNEVIRGLDFVFVSIEDVLIASSSTEEDVHHLHILFERFKKYGNVIDP